MMSVTADGTIKYWNPESGIEINKFQLRNDEILNLDINEDGS